MNVLALALLQLSAISAAPQTYEAAHAESMESGRPLLVLVGADWCPACVQMKNNVMPELARRGVLKRVSFASVNSDRQGRLAGRLSSGGSIPQLIMYRKTSSGWRRSTLIGGQSTGSVTAFIDRAVEPKVQPASVSSSP